MPNIKELIVIFNVTIKLSYVTTFDPKNMSDKLKIKINRLRKVYCSKDAEVLEIKSSNLSQLKLEINSYRNNLP